MGWGRGERGGVEEFGIEIIEYRDRVFRYIKSNVNDYASASLLFFHHTSNDSDESSPNSYEDRENSCVDCSGSQNFLVGCPGENAYQGCKQNDKTT